MFECIITFLSFIVAVIFLRLIFQRRISQRFQFALCEIFFVTVLLVGCASTSSVKDGDLTENKEIEETLDENDKINNQNTLDPTSSEAEKDSVVKFTYELIHLENGTIDGNVEVLSENEITVVNNAISDFMIKSSAWPGVDIDKLSDCYQINWIFEDGSILEYYTFITGDKTVMQFGKDGQYSIIDNKSYENIVNLFYKILEEDEDI